MKISFDFDGCLGDNKFVQLICKVFQSAGHEVFIITSRDPQMEIVICGSFRQSLAYLKKIFI